MGVLKTSFFRGQSLHRLDEKGRLRIPTKFRDVLQQHYTDALIVTVMHQCLVAYPPEVWESVENKTLKLSRVDPKHRAFVRLYVSNAEECEFDTKGRILIPPVLRQLAGLKEEVLLAGVLEGFEIWDKERWDRHVDVEPEQYSQIMNVIAETGL